MKVHKEGPVVRVSSDMIDDGTVILVDYCRTCGLETGHWAGCPEAER